MQAVDRLRALPAGEEPRKPAGFREDGLMPAVLLLNMGGPESLEEVGPFLRTLFEDPLVQPLPGGRFTRRILGRSLASLRCRRIRAAYARIGGGSPLRRLTVAQAALLRAELERRGYPGIRVEPILRYTEPRAEHVLARLAAFGEMRALALPLYPQECSVTTGSSLAEIESVRPRVAAHLSIDVVRSYHRQEGYVTAVAERITETLGQLGAQERDDAVLLFSAHGVPVRLVQQGDPYVDQIGETVEAVMESVGREQPYRLSFQTRAAPVRRVGPTMEDTIGELSGARAVVVVPISFVSDHIETLYEIDCVYAEQAKRCGIGRFLRIGSLHDSPRFCATLADLVEDWLKRRDS